MQRVRRAALLVLTGLLALAVAACGGGDGPDAPVAARPGDADQLLRDTFSHDEEIESGRLEFSLRVDSARAAAPMLVRLSGPFESEGRGRLPRFALAAELEKGGRRVTAGATSTGDAGYVRLLGEDYAVAGPVFQQFKAGYEQVRAQGGGSLASLGIDASRWVANARIAGEAKVGDADTIKIAGDVDVPALLADIDAALVQARALGLGAGRLPSGLTPAQRRRAERKLEAAEVAVYTGKDDHILRRLHVDARVAEREAGRGTVALDLSLTGVNDGQEIAAPGDPRPFGDLVRRLRALSG